MNEENLCRAQCLVGSSQFKGDEVSLSRPDQVVVSTVREAKPRHQQKRPAVFLPNSILLPLDLQITGSHPFVAEDRNPEQVSRVLDETVAYLVS